MALPSVSTPPSGPLRLSPWRRVVAKASSIMNIVIATVGPGGFIAVGYIDPGNWATDLQGGAKFQYKLMFVVLLSGIIAIALQSLTVRLGIVTGKDLPQLCRSRFPPWANFILWILAELAIIATDLAEVIGAAIALKLLFGLRIFYGVLIMGLDVLIVLAGWNDKHLRYFEVFIFFLIFMVGLCFTILLGRLPVEWGPAFLGYLPSSLLVTNSDALYTSLGILGATVMPHNLYLHSALVQFRSPEYREMKAGARVQGEGEPIQHHGNTTEMMALSRRDSVAVGTPILLEEVRPIGSLAGVGGTARFEPLPEETSLMHQREAGTREPVDAEEQAPNPLDHRNSLLTLHQLPVKAPSRLKLQKSVQSIFSRSVTIDFHAPFRKLPRHHLTEIKKTLHHLNMDSLVSLTYATVINSFILITAAAAFYGTADGANVSGIGDAYNLLKQMLGSGMAALFAIGLFCSGQCSTVTGTLASQVVMEGFLGGEGLKGDDWKEETTARDAGFLVTDAVEGTVVADGAENETRTRLRGLARFSQGIVLFFRKRMWARRLLTRVFALVPAMVVCLVLGDAAVDSLLVVSQVVLSLLLPFAVWPLVYFTSSSRVMTVEYVGSKDVSGVATATDATSMVQNSFDDGNLVVSYVNSVWFTIVMSLIALVITTLNLYMLSQVSLA
ncbi:natural resistance-associated macrophage protein-domain-containing protein [Chytriomyces sp. MP71]|nr:natural resistance-associated macrophage protein-domain-containing protein [Chytriomyces sp. MP71]